MYLLQGESHQANYEIFWQDCQFKINHDKKISGFKIKCKSFYLLLFIDYEKILLNTYHVFFPGELCL